MDIYTNPFVIQVLDLTSPDIEVPGESNEYDATWLLHMVDDPVNAQQTSTGDRVLLRIALAMHQNRLETVTLADMLDLPIDQWHAISESVRNQWGRA